MDVLIDWVGKVDVGTLIAGVIAQGVGAAGVYGAIRASIAKLAERSTQALNSATRAHVRIDDMQRDQLIAASQVTVHRR